MFANFYKDKVVLVTGHTGFKGAWLCEWLLGLGAEVHGYSNAVEGQPNLFEALGLSGRLKHHSGDVRDRAALDRRIRESRPDLIFHLAAQPLVRLSYREPLETIQTNVMGTIHLLESLRGVDWPVTTLVVTSDKCYENREIHYGYREDDSLGGFDPYSASKGAVEVLFQSYRRCFFSEGRALARVGSARAGNVIGGGDWAADRLVPDAIRSLSRGEPIPVRNPRATRPWQHVLEPLSGYLTFAWRMASGEGFDRSDPKTQAHLSFNFGPTFEGNRPVRDLVQEILKSWNGSWQDLSDPNALHEAGFLNLAIDKAHHFLQWKPVLGFSDAVRMTANWYRKFYDRADPVEITANDIRDYTDRAKTLELIWAN